MTEQQTFKLGDKVAHRTFGQGVVRFGPYAPALSDEATRFLVELESHPGRHGTFDAGDLTAVPTYKHGDRVLAYGESCTVEAGPFVDKYDPDRPWYVVKNADGSHETSSESRLKPAPADEPIKVGDRVRVLEAKHAEEFHGTTGRVIRTDGTWTPRDGELHPYRVELDNGGIINARRVERITDDAPAGSIFVYNSVTYDLTAEYRDQDGDVWRLTRDADGIPLATMGDIRFACRALHGVIDEHGPLTKITD
ncbi:phiSA1p31-related protein [Kitasatospora sp. NPDC086009]|uniref:phiSA1p31-related protein n=1 Tax=unclassified Kitasatospora TaxID=2633591 RepID=UPI0037CA04E8